MAKKSTKSKVVTIDRRAQSERRKATDRRSKDKDVNVERRKIERREKVNRRRQIDPTTCERDYTNEDVEFMQAMDQYKRKSGRMFPTCSEVLEVIRDLGYVKQPKESPAVASIESVTEPAVGDLSAGPMAESN